jgi:hypothetical protein
MNKSRWQAAAFAILALAGLTAPAAQAQYIPAAPCPAHQWANAYGFTTGLGCAQPSFADLAGTANAAQVVGASSGFVNKLRGNSLSQWYGGTSMTITTAGGWASEGVFVAPSGASVTASRDLSPRLGGPYYSLKILGAASNTDVKLRFPIESYDAAALAGQTVTFQITYQNKSGGSLTPTLTTKSAGSQDVWTSPTTDLAAASMQSCANNTICTAAYTLSISPNANNGYTATVDVGALVSGAYIEVISFDMRPTPGVVTGTNPSPPAPEIRGPATDGSWCKRFYSTSYDNGIAAGAVTDVGAVQMRQAAVNGPFFNLVWPTAMRAIPVVTVYSPNTGASGKYYDYTAVADAVITQSTVSTSNAVYFNASAGASGDRGGMHYTADARIPGA